MLFFQWYCPVADETLIFSAEEANFAENMAASVKQFREMTRRDVGLSYYYPPFRLEIWLDKWRPVAVQSIKEHGMLKCYNIAASVPNKNAPKYDPIPPDELEFCKTQAPIWWKAVQHLWNTTPIRLSPPPPSRGRVETPLPAAEASGCTRPGP